MSAPLSVVIPTLDAAPALGPCLGALSPGLMDGLIAELILADGGSTDGTADIAEAVGARLVTAPRGRGTQLAAGCAAARGDWLMILHADTLLPQGWERSVAAHVRGDPGLAGYWGLGFDDRGLPARLVGAWANLRSGLGLPYGDQGLVLSARLYREVGGYPEVPLMEDVAIVRRIGRRRLRRLPDRVVTSAERYRRDGWLARGARNLTTLALWAAGVPEERLARRYGQR